ncbi:hypothetical protein [Lactococcus petauri]|uniref:hypothetical protein n=1 Tax=Lactococcus petauri TaxID=1940789 RepID=UPI001F56F097|nr:hypothetical protein [Lactococcus petauri]
MGADGNKEYRDSEHISSAEPIYEEIKNGIKTEHAIKVAKWLREKEWGVDVRESLAVFVQWLDVRVNDVLKKFKNLLKRQEDVEARQAQVENKFKDVIANATEDSEVINARDSSYFGKFTVLGDRLENIEKYLSSYVPQGVLITVKREMNRLPEDVYITSYDYGLGVVPLGTEPEGMFGGTTEQAIEMKIISWADNLLKIRVPLDYSDFKFKYRPEDDKYYLQNDTHCLLIHFSEGKPIGDEFDTTQVIVEKTQTTNTQLELMSRIANIEEKLSGE